MPTEAQARALMTENMENNPEFEAGYWFPDTAEIRLIYVDPTSIPNEPEAPVATYRMAHEADGETVPLIVGFVRPEEAERLPLPPRWGQGWRDATRVPALRQVA